MTPLEGMLSRRKLILALVLLLTLSGAFLWMTMVRQEDPRLPDYWGQVVVPFPGAPAETIEHLVLEPVEDALAAVSEIQVIDATAFDEVAVLALELRPDTRDFDKAWDEVKEALYEARREFPEGAGEPVLNEDLQDQDSVVLAITGHPDILKLLDGARTLKKELLALDTVSRVEILADPGEQVTVELNDSAAERLGLTPPELARRLSARSHILPGGTLKAGGKRVRLRPLSEFLSLEEIGGTSVLLRSGTAIPLEEVGTVRLGPEEPVSSRMRLNGETAVGLAVVPRTSINLVKFGQTVRERVLTAAPELVPLNIREVTFQPKRTETRLAELNSSLILGVLIVAGVLVLFMGARLGFLVASIVPVVTLMSLAVFSWSGGVLHQISIASLVLALGILVDNAIVVAENVQWRIDQGHSPSAAAQGAVRELAVPLAGATATTLAAFTPMLLSEGPTAAFTRSIPVVIMLTLTVSYLCAVFLTPVLSEMILVPRPSRGAEWTRDLGGRLARIALRHRGWVLFLALIAVSGSFVAARGVKQQFFPTSDRNQLIVDLKRPEGTHLDATDASCRTLEAALLEWPDVTKVATFMGRSAPRFYYNIPNVPFSPHYAQIIVETRSKEDNDRVLDRLRNFAQTALPEAEVVARKLEQGPPVDAPIEVRITGNDLNSLNQTANRVSQTLGTIPGTRDVRHDMGPGGPTLRFHIDDAAAARHGLTRADIAQAVYGRTRGLVIGQLRSREDPIPVVIRSSAGESFPPEELESIGVPGGNGRLIPLAQVARMKTAWSPAAIRHRNGQRVATVSAQLAEGTTYSQVLPQIQAQLGTLDLPHGVDLSFGGDLEGSGEANSALMRRFPIAVLILIGVLLAEFNSFRRLLLILTTIPLSSAGVIPGLLIGNQPFGFMSLLGVIALVGIVVNNAIVLLEAIEDRRREGADLEAAVTDAVSRRIRPILLTMATTIAGLLPLAFSPSTLWPPLASSMISGLLGSTLLTLLVVPALYRVLFGGFLKHGLFSHRTTATRVATTAATMGMKNAFIAKK